MKVLIIEDDAKIADFLTKGFREVGFVAESTASGIQGQVLASGSAFDLLIVDIMLPEKSGLDLVQDLRRSGVQTPVLFLSAKRSTEDRVEGLQRGGDDYLTKPFSFSELLARSNAILRRTTKQVEGHRISFQGLELDPLSRTVKRGGREIDLQQKEFSLLEYLLRNQGNVLTKTQILEKVWNYDFDPQTNVVDVLVCRLRNKVDRDQPMKLIKTIRGVGYVLRAD